MSSNHNSPQSEAAPRAPQIAYLLSRYPAVSHTFFLREILGLRALGLPIAAASINPPDRLQSQLPPEESAEAATTFYVKGRSHLRSALQVAAIALRSPAALLRGLRAASRLARQTPGTRLLLLAYLAEALLVGHWMRQRKLSWLHVHFGGPVATVGLLTAQAWQIPWSLTLHGPDEFFDQSRFWLRSKFLSANRIFAISHFTRSQILRIAPEASSRVQVRRLGVDIAALDAIKAPPPNPATIQIVCTGRLVPAKGQRILLQAFAQILNTPGPDLRSDLRLTLIGDGPDRPALEQLASQLGISGHIRWMGALRHSDTLHELSQAHLFVLPSFAEGLPVALMEAMALRIPCISTFIAGIPELIENKTSGLLVPAGAIPQLAEAILSLAQNQPLRELLAENARKTVELQYNLKTNLAHLANDLLTQMTTETSPRATPERNSQL